ncbi:MAG: sigma-70 family RNA polymerase sigma factor [bacterium]
MAFEKPDEEIINLYKGGNKEVFKELIDKYTSPLYNFTVRLTDKENAPDIIQDVFIKIWKNINSFDIEKSSFKTWLFTIAQNTIVDFWRKSKDVEGKKKILSFSDLEDKNNDYVFSENIQDESLLPDEALQKLQDKELLNKLIDKLPQSYKTVLILHYQEDITFLEIGKILGKPQNTVKSYHHRAIIKLREMII